MSRTRNRLALPAGYQLGRYVLGAQLGAGSFGITYLANDTELQRQVAVKELLPRDIVSRGEDDQILAIDEADDDQWDWAQERFMQEATTVAACDHPNVLHVYETFRANGTVYMVTRYQPGQVLKSWLDGLGRPPTESEIRSILVPILQALERVHARGFLHRDIQPQNIYLTDSSGPLLIDFGSARQVVSSRSRPMTTIVSEGYAPFEQYAIAGHQGPWTDLYGLAAVMYHCITGQKPPGAPERAQSAGKDPCISLAAKYARQYSAELLASIDAALRIEPQQRTQSAADWLRALQGLTPPAPQPVPAGPPPIQPAPAPVRAVAPSGPQKGADITCHVTLSMQEIATGCEKVVEFEKQLECPQCKGAGLARPSSREPCRSCGGAGAVNAVGKVRLRLPRNTPHGTRLNSVGQGHAGLRGGAPGDLFIVVGTAAAPLPRPDVPPAATGGRFGAAVSSAILPGIGSVPRICVFSAMLYLLATAGMYWVGIELLDYRNQTVMLVAFALAGLLHLGGIIAAWTTGSPQEEARFFPRSAAGWFGITALLLVLAGEILVLQSPNDLPLIGPLGGL